MAVLNPRILSEEGNTVYFRGLEANTTYTLTYRRFGVVQGHWRGA